jgi:TetR/AcrR family transcriptional regulator, transcriptional repressor for nem operon
VPREKAFCPKEAREELARLFSTHGYGGTSMAQLTEATGVGKQSLYNTFGDKEAMYLEAVECAVARFGTVTRSMASSPSGRESLSVFFDHLVDLATSPDPAQQSCIVSAGLLEAIESPTVRLVLQAKWRATHELLRAAIERGQRDGSIVSKLPSAELADLLMSVMSGLRVAVRAEATRARVEATARLALSLLDQ